MPFFQFQKKTLQNGLQLINVSMPWTEAVTLLVLFSVGSRYEREKLSGVSHFIEHMMFKGTKKRPSTLILTREIDRLGAEYNAFTSKEYTGYFIKADSQYLPISLDILSDMLFNSVFNAEEMKKEKKVIAEEIKMYKDNPMMNLENVFEGLMYQKCPLGQDVSGSEKTVSGFKREEILNFKDKHYNPQNMVIVIAGQIGSQAEKMIEDYFGRRAVKRNFRNKFIPAKFGPQGREKRIAVEHKKTDQTQMMIGFPGFNYNSKYNPALAVMGTILGGIMSSRLFIEIREKRGLAYMIQSGGENFRDTGYVSIRAGLDAKNINQAISVIKSELARIAEKGVKAKELSDAKTHIRGALTLSLEDSSAVASWYAKQAMFMNKIKTPEEKLKEIESVSNADIKSVTEKIFDFDQMRVAVIGDVDRDKIVF